MTSEGSNTPIKQEAEEIIVDTYSPANNPIERNSFKCSVCGDYFFNENGFLEHAWDHVLPTREEGAAKTGSESLQKTGGDATTETIPEERSTSFNNQNTLPSTPNAKDPVQEGFICNVCSYRTHYKSALTRHVRLHSAVLPFSCKQCDYRCNEQQHLKNHTSRHTGEKPFKCSTCSYASARKSALKRHSLLHGGLPTYACSSCKYKCNEKNNLKRHTLFKHKAERPFKCGVCSYATVDKSHLTIHCRRHTFYHAPDVTVGNTPSIKPQM